jgi:hypothetical protein
VPKHKFYFIINKKLKDKKEKEKKKRVILPEKHITNKL